MNKRRIQRQTLFNVFSKQLELGGVTPVGVFVCPLCRAGFCADALDGASPSLTLAHIIPDCLGGRAGSATLSCVQCNNDNGASIESYLLERFKYEDWEHGYGKKTARMTGEFGSIGIELTRSAPTSGWDIHPLEKHSNPRSLEQYRSWMDNLAHAPNQDPKLSFTWTIRNRPAAVSAGICQSAYLTMFAYFGYDFAFREQYEKYRNHVLNPSQTPCPVKINMVAPDAWNVLGVGEANVMFVRKPFKSIGVFMRFKPDDGRDRGFCIFFPSPEDENGTPPDFEMGPVEGVLLPRKTEILAHEPWALSRGWSAFTQRPIQP